VRRRLIFLKLRRRVLIETRKSKNDEKYTVCKEAPRVKIMNMLKATEKVMVIFRTLALQCKMYAKEGSQISKLIIIQIEEIKRKVGFHSPASLRFIGPGDQNVNLIQRGVITNI
jgi:hypothetical protein